MMTMIYILQANREAIQKVIVKCVNGHERNYMGYVRRHLFQNRFLSQQIGKL